MSLVMTDVAANIEAVRARIAAACEVAGRRPEDVRLLPVSKTHPATAIRLAYDAGCRRFGENKVQELEAKAAELVGLPELGWSFIGHLQTNKAKSVARLAAEFQALDSLRLGVELDRRLQAEGRALDVLIEVNSSGEQSKFGVAPEEVVPLARQLASCHSLRLRGLMTLAVPSPDAALVAACFERVRAAQTRLRDELGGEWHELSMGMSGDLELAIAHGSTCVRVGTAIFGART